MVVNKKIHILCHTSMCYYVILIILTQPQSNSDQNIKYVHSTCKAAQFGAKQETVQVATEIIEGG